MWKTALVIVASAFTAGNALAQDVYIEDSAPADRYYADEAIEPSHETVIVGPRVYGWTAVRPDDCGTFKYWNGEYCADARFEPPRD